MRPLIVYDLDGESRTFRLERDEITIGRDATNDLVIRKTSISRRHAKVHRVGQGWRVTDLGSLNGTRVNDRAADERNLEDGDRIVLHDMVLVFRMPGSSTRVELGSPGREALSPHTVVHSTVDFSSLVSGRASTERLRKLMAIVTETSHAILASTSLDETLGRVLDLVFAHLPVQRGAIMIWDEERQDLIARCARDEARTGGEMRFSRTIAEKVYRDKVAVLTADAQSDGRFIEGASVVELGIRSAMAAPLWRGEKVEGLIYVDALRSEAFDHFDLDLLSALGNHIAVAIEQSRLQKSILEQQLVRRRLERYHSPAVIDLITARNLQADDALVADERDVTVLFADIVDFSSRCESLSPHQIADLLNRYFSEMTERIFQHQGTLDKYIGDCIMAVFGAPLTTADHATRAAAAALDMRESLRALNDPLPKAAQVQFRIGIHSGRVVAGDIGSVRRSDYTVLGATVNLAARLESGVAQPGQIVISKATWEAIDTEFETRFIGEQRLRGMSEPMGCYELIGRRNGPESRSPNE